MTFNKLLFWTCVALIGAGMFYGWVIEPAVQIKNDVQAYQAKRLYPFND